MKRICECLEGATLGYVNTAFAGDFLLSTSCFPDFKLTVWSWRTGIKILSVDAILREANEYEQIMRVNPSSSSYIAQVEFFTFINSTFSHRFASIFHLMIFLAFSQLGKTSGKLFIWKLCVCNKAAFLDSTEIIPPKNSLINDIAWQPYGSNTLALVDQYGHVYLTDHLGKDIVRVILSQRCLICTDYEKPLISWYVDGIVMRTTFCQIRYYQKDSTNRWQKIWYHKVDYHPCALIFHPFRTDR